MKRRARLEVAINFFLVLEEIRFHQLAELQLSIFQFLRLHAPCFANHSAWIDSHSLHFPRRIDRTAASKRKAESDASANVIR